MVSNNEMFDKARKVIDSCVTQEQLEVAKNYFHLCKFEGENIKCEYTSALLDFWFEKEKDIKGLLQESVKFNSL